MQKILIVGSGDIARRVFSRFFSRFAGHYRAYALLREPDQAAWWRAAGAIPLFGDLDDRASLRRLAGLADRVLHLAPPPGTGHRDTRTRNLLAALGAGGSLPRQLIYIGTTGVYGDCAGVLIDETRPCRPQSERAARRVDAERRLRDWGRRRGVRVSILRAPGIYAADRLPLERLRQGLPALLAAEDAWSNHLHADDLAAACVAALRRGRANRVVNIVDDSRLRMADYFDRVADAFALPRPRRLSWDEAATRLSPLQLSFMRESRQIGNHRLKQELKLRLAYPTVEVGIAEAAAGKNTCSS
ncbi:MAG: NAD-dependent epimerase/dehydratase family protein [Azonexus sp.]|uniref:NAD-dependent epimerase/dehydratase family protein n=1 Tax=Azonexus sp. TaxID=1872668 RepID=UPI002820F170|nr:NAD-dependent epimerase/dehydratase family protein [Azonexus sp.]MDR0775836.1 NAD-dependent epimerase/dehydratase family protein [Azonexus sp.]